MKKESFASLHDLIVDIFVTLIKIRRGKLGWFRDSSTSTLRCRTQGNTEEAGLSTVSFFGLIITIYFVIYKLLSSYGTLLRTLLNFTDDLLSVCLRKSNLSLSEQGCKIVYLLFSTVLVTWWVLLNKLYDYDQFGELLGRYGQCFGSVFVLYRSGSSTFKTWNFFIFSTFVGHFCPPGSRSGFRIRIHWPDWIRIQSGSETLGRTAQSFLQ